MLEAGTRPEVGGCGGLAWLGFCCPGVLLAGARGCLGFGNAPFRIGNGVVEALRAPVPVLSPRLITNARSEALNTKTQGVKAAARGRGFGMFFDVSDGLG